MLNFLITTVLITAFIACGGKPGGLRSFEDMVPEFTKKLNQSLETGTFDELISLLDKKCIVIVNTEFNPEYYTGHAEALTYFNSIPLQTTFEIGEIKLVSLRAETNYRFNLPGEGLRIGTWLFKLNNMGRISEFTVTPGE